jgi:hypothetical protein
VHFGSDGSFLPFEQPPCGASLGIAGERDQQVKALQMQWTPSHYGAYQEAFGGLLAKQLVEDAGAQSFRITDAGLKAIGVATPRPAPQAAVPQVQDLGEQPGAEKQVGVRGAFSRLMSGLLGQRT